MVKHFYTYIHRKATDGSVFYVGKGTRKRAWDIKHRNRKWENIVAKHGRTVEICATWICEEDAFEHEKFLILCFKDMGCNLANLTNGGDGPNGYKYSDEQKQKMKIRRLGYKHSEETKRKISAAQIGIPRNKVSEEAKAKMSAAQKARIRMPMSNEAKKKLSKNNGSRRQDVKDKISIALTGRKSSEETKAKISLHQKGKPKSPEHKEKIRLARLVYFDTQRKLYGKAQSISEEHKAALRTGYNKHFGLTNEADK